MGFHAGRNIDDPRRGNVRETVAKRARSLKKLKKKQTNNRKPKFLTHFGVFFFPILLLLLHLLSNSLKKYYN